MYKFTTYLLTNSADAITEQKIIHSGSQYTEESTVYLMHCTQKSKLRNNPPVRASADVTSQAAESATQYSMDVMYVFCTRLKLRVCQLDAVQLVRKISRK